MSPQDLARCTGARLDRAERFLPAIQDAMHEFGINTTARQAAFLAQIGHESGGLRWLTEIWGPTPAQRSYEGREGLGNTEKGDGFAYRGRGLIQLTGRANYRAAGAALGLDLEGNPDLAAEPVIAARIAGWFWRKNGLNELADEGNFMRITRRINGGLNGLPERQALWDAGKAALA